MKYLSCNDKHMWTCFILWMAHMAMFHIMKGTHRHVAHNVRHMWSCLMQCLDTHCDSWRIRDQLDVTSYYVLFHFFYAQHVSDINTSIIRSLRLFCCITTLVMCSHFDVCWSFGVAGLGWYPCSSLLHGYHPNPATPKLQHTSKQEHTTNVVLQ